MPQENRHGRPVWRPFLRQQPRRFRVRTPIQPLQAAHRLLKGDVFSRKEIRAAKCEHAIDFGAPAAETFKCHDRPHRFVIGHIGERGDVQGARCHGFRQGTAVSDLWPGQARSPQSLLLKRHKLRGIPRRTKRIDTRADGARSIPRDLLRDDDVHQRGKAVRADTRFGIPDKVQSRGDLFIARGNPVEVVYQYRFFHAA